MGALKVNIICSGENMQVQQLQIEPDNWHHRFEISVVSKMEDNRNVISIEMNEVFEQEVVVAEKKIVKLDTQKASPQPTKTHKVEQPISKVENEYDDEVDGAVWL